MLMDLLSKACHYRHAELCDFEHAGDGCGLTVSQIIEPLRNARLLVLALLANFVLMPLARSPWQACSSSTNHSELGCCCSDARPARRFCRSWLNLPKATSPLLSATMVLLMVVTVGYLPIVLPLLLPGVTVNPGKIAHSLVLLMLLPLAAGLALKAYYGGMAARVKPVLDWISNISLILLVLLITAANIDKVLEVFGTRGILAGLLFIALGFGNRVVARRTGQRHQASAGAGNRPAQHRRRTGGRSQSFSDPKWSLW